MSDFENELHHDDLDVHYSRRHRQQTLNQTQGLSWENMLGNDEVWVDTTLRWPHYISYALLSLIVSATTVVLPYLSEFASGLQVQYLYTGMAVSYGQLPYINHFATGGFLYYVIVALLAPFQKGLLLVGVQWLALFLAGIYVEKSLIRLTNRDDLGQGLTIIFYALQLAFGFGGLYPIQWATPFLVMGFYYLSQYILGQAKDEILIAYGFVAGLSVLLDPKTVLFWLLALIILASYNISHKRWARGFYQLLALLFGLVIPVYIALYFMLNFQVLSPALRQAVIYPLLVPAFEMEDFWLSLGLQLGALLMTGVLTGWFLFRGIITSRTTSKFLYWLLFLVTLVYGGFALLSQTLWLYPLLYVLPFGLLLTGAWLATISDKRRPNMAVLFVGKQFLIPLLALLVAVAYPVGRGFLEKPLNHERDLVANYLVKQTSSEDKIYVWDQTSRIYLKAGRQSASQITSPAFYRHDKANAALLEDELLQHDAKYLVVNKYLALPNALEKALSKTYQEVPNQDFTNFTIYQAK